MIVLRRPLSCCVHASTLEGLDRWFPGTQPLYDEHVPATKEFFRLMQVSRQIREEFRPIYMKKAQVFMRITGGPYRKSGEVVDEIEAVGAHDCWAEEFGRAGLGVV